MSRNRENSGRNQAVVERDSKGRFPPGVSGNPAGKPVGARNGLTLLAESLAADRAERILATLFDLAERGDPVALRLVVERIWPRPDASAVALEVVTFTPRFIGRRGNLEPLEAE
jgi:hypothetical protein